MIKFNNIFAAVVLVTSLPVGAQSAAPGVQGSMQSMMQGAAQMAACFQNLDQAKLQAMGEEGKVIQAQIKQLCANGERDQAQETAMNYGLKFIASEEFQKLQQCGEIAQQMMPAMPDYAAYADPDSEENQNRHVCDEI